MKRLFFYWIALIFSFSTWFCATPMLQDDEIATLNEAYSGVYVLTQDVDAGNSVTVRAGTKIRLYFKSGEGSVKVYGYHPDQSREGAVGNNILYLFEADFPEGEYDRAFLELKLNKVVRKLN